MSNPVNVQFQKAAWFTISSVGLYLTYSSCKANKIHPLIATMSATAGFIYSGFPIAKVILIHNFNKSRMAFFRGTTKGDRVNVIAIPIRDYIYKSAVVGFVDPVLRQLPIIKIFGVFKRIALVKVAAASLAWFELGFMIAQTIASGFICFKTVSLRLSSNRGQVDTKVSPTLPPQRSHEKSTESDSFAPSSPIDSSFSDIGGEDSSPDSFKVDVPPASGESNGSTQSSLTPPSSGTPGIPPQFGMKRVFRDNQEALSRSLDPEQLTELLNEVQSSSPQLDINKKRF